MTAFPISSGAPGMARLVPVRHFAEALPAMVTDVGRLVGRESPSADPAAVARSATAVGALGAELMGAEPEFLVADGCTHLRWRLGDGPRRVLILGHHDTVWPIGSLASLPWSAEGGVLRGPGCFDMKAGLVLVFHALHALRDVDGVTVFVSGDEEIGSPTGARFIEREARDCAAVLVAEPGAVGGALKTVRKGVAHYELSVHGRAAHAGLEPERGINAAIEAAHRILAITALSDPAAGTTVTPTTLTAGTTVNSVPDTATVAIDVRASEPAELDRVERALQAMAPNLPDAVLDVTSRMRVPPLSAASSAALFGRARQIAAALGLGELRAATVGGGSDGNKTAALGVPTLDGLGAVGGGAHAADEHVLIDELPRRAALLANLVASLLSARPNDH
jgi:glutamate carboxypeptidase